MAERPLLMLPTPGEAPRDRQPGGGGNIRFPARSKQVERLAPEFKALSEALDKRRASLQISDPGVVPEEVAVLDLRGTVDDFLKATRRVTGLEWLAELDADDVDADDDFYATTEKGKRNPDAPVPRRLFLVFVNHEALTQLISLFRRFEKDEKMPSGSAPWRHVFKQLKAVRTWNATDRLHESGLVEALEDEEAIDGQMVSCELDLWFRNNLEKRTEAEARVRTLVHDRGGTAAQSCVIPEIHYHALPVRLPTATVRQLVHASAGDIELADCHHLQYVRAAGQMSVSVADAYPERSRPSRPPTDTRPRAKPAVALFDGLPLAQHERIRDYLFVDDPDDYASAYSPDRCRHGTAMASLVVHGDLGAPGPPVSRRVYHRPILRPDPGDINGRAECIRSETPAPDLVWRAVRRMLVGEGTQPPSAPSVAVVGLALGLRNRPFARTLSPLARLLDWLSWKHKVLFIVSAGNHTALPGPAPRSWTGSVQKFENERHTYLQSLAAATAQRRLLSPAESVNALTVGAEHTDESSDIPPPSWHLVGISSELPSPISAHGLGFRRSVKPDLLLPGGRIAIKETFPGSQARMAYDGSLAPGQRVAAPSRQPGVLDAAVHTRGTSGATALAVRSAAFLHDLLDDLRLEPDGHIVDAVPPSIWIKTLLAHAADWGKAKAVLRDVLEGTSHQDKWRDFIGRMIGYGAADVDRASHCTSHRVVALGGGLLEHGKAHNHRFPLPSVAASGGHWKKLTITLSWMTPVNPMHQNWRRAKLWFDTKTLKIGKRQADWRTVRRGTVQHEVFEGEGAIAPSNHVLELHVNCSKDAGTLEASVPYALAVTLEMAERIGVDIYAQVREKLEAMRVPVPATN